MNKKLYDLVVKTGEYTDGQGQPKGRFKNIGVMMEGQNGPYILLDRTFNPAGVGGNDGRENIIVSLYEPRQDNQQQPSPAQPKASTYQPQPSEVDDSIPF